MGEQVRAKPHKVRRPEIKKGISEDKFLHYQTQWVRYKRVTGLVDKSRLSETSCCLAALRRRGELVRRAARYEDGVRADFKDSSVSSGSSEPLGKCFTTEVNGTRQ